MIEMISMRMSLRYYLTSRGPAGGTATIPGITTTRITEVVEETIKDRAGEDSTALKVTHSMIKAQDRTGGRGN
jgi:hypothetical protein